MSAGIHARVRTPCKSHAPKRVEDGCFQRNRLHDPAEPKVSSKAAARRRAAREKGAPYAPAPVAQLTPRVRAAAVARPGTHIVACPAKGMKARICVFSAIRPRLLHRGAKK